MLKWAIVILNLLLLHQALCLGPAFFILFIDRLLNCIKNPTTAFADDLEFVAYVTMSTCEVQADIYVVADWFDHNNMPLSTEKCLILHCGQSQMFYNYTIHGALIQISDAFQDFGIQQSSLSGYARHYDLLTSKVSRVSGTVRKTFQSSSKELL